ncbi:hypothetical protein E2562_026692 [Oryza meyeriana var. granulata]|uniref:Uncharacterized protein n=1 Tax=Oryza meyeriana var. granulata TaxID=110450 RepID=A0A6G1E2C2_9ORYZ|nr:hypothetical protein E2562_026692 [Oryza meyeriana var. granulata]
MAMETRIRLMGSQNVLDKCHDGMAPLDEGPSYVRFVCALTVKHSTRRLGERGLAVPLPDGVRQFAMTMQSDVLPVDDPSVFLDYEETRRMAWRMITGLAGLDRYDLSRGNWRTSKPDDVVANWIHDLAQTNDDRGLCGGHYRLVVFIHVEVNLVFSEPKNLLAVMYCREPKRKACEICLDDLTWLFKETTCPRCRGDLRNLVHAPCELSYQRYAPTD